MSWAGDAHQGVKGPGTHCIFYTAPIFESDNNNKKHNFIHGTALTIIVPAIHARLLVPLLCDKRLTPPGCLRAGLVAC